MKPYKYQPLRDSLSEYRVLLIHPAADTSSPLCISLLPCNVNQYPKYIALSYMWGTNVPNHAIVVVALDAVADGTLATVEGEIVITENLAQAIQQHRHISRFSAMWADQLCIDQQNIHERSAQVRIMNLIFEKAHRVNCWLGLEPFGVNHGEAALKKLQDIHLYIEQCSAAADPFSEMSIENLSECIDIYDPTILGTYGDIVDKQLWEAIFVFLRNSWWHRTWIMPEVLRQNQPYVILQGSAFGLWKMCKALQCVGLRLLNELKRENINNAIYSSFLELVVAALDRHQTLIMLTRIQGETLQFPLRLTKTLEATRASMATDPRDKVYAAIGCMSNVQKSSLLVPDYSLPIRTVYGRVVEYMIHTLNNLMIFSTIQPPPAETLTDLPSWIPDWRIPVSTPAGFSSQQSIYDASGGTQARVWIDSEYIELKLAGFSVDTIRHVSTTYTTEHRSCLRLELATFVPFIRDWYSRALLMLGNLYRTGASTLDAFCITRVMGRKDYPRERGSSFPASVLTDRSDTIEVLFNEFSQIELPPESVVGSLHQAVYQAFFISHDGYMGLCPRNTQQGDKIFILLGGNMPAVLRLVKGGYQFIGFAYVYGLMDGEAMVGLETGQYRLQEEITLL